MLKKIYLRKLISKGYIVVDSTNHEEMRCNNEELAMILKSFSSLGYTLEQECIKSLSMQSSDYLNNFYRTYFSLLKEVSGVKEKHYVFYKYIHQFI